MMTAFARLGLLAAFMSLVSVTHLIAEEPVDFDRDIRPILSDHCFACHGPDENQRQTTMRLDLEASAKGELDGGGFPILAGDLAKSEIILRITHADAELQMPPAEFNKPLEADQITLLKKWIEQGAVWQSHWSFKSPQKVALPAVKVPGSQLRNPIDYFIQARLEHTGMTLSSEAEKASLVRRVTLDLTGLPPTLKEIDDFLADEQDGAYERLVERLLQSPRYGEHQTRQWLDVARYGDTHGLHLDNIRSLWPYRDWVIRAFNNNMPFDKFTVEQLAGDLLPEPTLDQLIATGFNRCNVTTSEGGSIAEEYRVRYAVDRVDTTATVWLGLTAGCAVCHDHKYDPISQREFYQLFAFFGNLDENPMDGNAILPPPIAKVPTPQQVAQKLQLETQIAAVQAEITGELAKIDYKEPEGTANVVLTQPEDFIWIDDELPKGAQPQTSGGGPTTWLFVEKPDNPVFCGQKSVQRSTDGLSQHFFTGADPVLTLGTDDRFFCYVYLDPKNPPKQLMLQFNDGSWDHRAVWGGDHIEWGTANTPSRHRIGDLPPLGEWVRLEVPIDVVGLKPGSKVNGWAFTQYDGTVFWDNAGLVTRTPQVGSTFDSLPVWEQVQASFGGEGLPANIRDIVKVEKDKRTAEQQKTLLDYFLEFAYSPAQEKLAPLHASADGLKKQLTELDQAIPGTMIMKERAEPRDTFVLTRGEYDKPDETRKVSAGTPDFLPPLTSDGPANRLALARWLVSPENPLTARVTVNRIWQQYFGTGLVKTAEDFGSQGERPSHPKLLDWLAVEFIESGWDLKHIHRLILTSATYRQNTKVDPEYYRKDRDNRLLGRGPRYRLDAETLRDQALFVSGLLVEDIGGPSVKPYQPPGLWEAVAYTGSNTAKFKADEGAALYRRSMYTFWKRTSPPPAMSTFDAPSRESCTVRRSRTNTPLQALLLLNDVQYVEAARHFAQRILTEGGGDLNARINFAFRTLIARQPTPAEREMLTETHKTFHQQFQAEPNSCTELLSVGSTPRNESLDAVEHATWTMISNLLLNLDETVTKG